MENPQPQAQLQYCFSCNLPLDDVLPRSSLPCGRIAHTRCVVLMAREVVYNHIDGCALCNQMLPNGYNDDNNSIHNQQTERERIRNLFETSEEFRLAAKAVVKSKTDYLKRYRAVSSLVVSKKQEIRNQLLVIKAQLQGLLETKEIELRDSPEYKEFLKMNRKHSMCITKLRRTYECSEKSLQRYLNDKPGFRRFTPLSWRYGHYRMFRRPFYFRIPI